MYGHHGPDTEEEPLHLPQRFPLLPGWERVRGDPEDASLPGHQGGPGLLLLDKDHGDLGQPAAEQHSARLLALGEHPGVREVYKE